MFMTAIVLLCLAQLLFLARLWLRVTRRDRAASSLRRLKRGLDWRSQGHRPRIKAGVSSFRELRGQ